MCLTYVDQDIPNPISFPNFELEITNIASSEEVHKYMIRYSGTNNFTSATKIDITSTRVNNYIWVHIIASTITQTLLTLLTRYNNTTKSYKS